MAHELFATAVLQLEEYAFKFGDDGIIKRVLNGALTHRRNIGKAHTIGRQHASVGMDEYLRHGEGVRDPARVLPTGPAEATQCVTGHIVPTLDGDLLDCVGHVVDRDRQVAIGNLFRRPAVTHCPIDFVGEPLELLSYNFDVECRVRFGAENSGKEIGIEFANHDVAVGHGQWPAVAIAGRSRIRTRRVGPNPITRTVKVEN